MWFFSDTDVGKKNIVFGTALFLLLGIGLSIPLTIDFFGGSTLGDQYQTWKVVHGYAVFLSFINYFVGFSIDRWNLTRSQKEIASWSFVAAGLAGGIGRPLVVLLSTLDTYGIYVSLAETVFITLGTIVFVAGQVTGKARTGEPMQKTRREMTPHSTKHGVA